jgi:hypothetical protein
LSQLLALVLILIGGAAFAQTSSPTRYTYSTPQVAVNDLVAATRARDKAKLRKIFGPELQDILSGDPVQDAADFKEFSENLMEKAKLAKQTNSKYTLYIGDEEWPFPIPLVKRNDRWVFDTKTGIDEITTRRIGENELSTMMTVKAYAVAQWEYFLEGDWDKDMVQEFAQTFFSQPGKKDGLYWPTVAGEAESPLGPLIAEARGEGYSLKRKEGAAQPTPYHGYYFKILKTQGRHAPGGAHSYVVNGNMISGFALLAYPAKYGSSGVMSFIVNQQGRVYEKDLGPNTEAIAKAMTKYDPDPSWELAEDVTPPVKSKKLEKVVKK